MPGLGPLRALAADRPLHSVQTFAKECKAIARKTSRTLAAFCGIRPNGNRGALGFFQNAPLNFEVVFSDPLGADKSSAAQWWQGFRA